MGPLDLMTAPLLGPLQMVYWLGQKLIEAAEGEIYDEGRLRGEIAELQARLDLGEVTEEEYGRQETALLERINAARGMGPSSEGQAHHWITGKGGNP